MADQVGEKEPPYVVRAHATAETALMRWYLRPQALVGTCDGCSEMWPLPYAEEETEAWLCQSCWMDAVIEDRLALALHRACQDGWADGEGAMSRYLRDAQAEIEAALADRSDVRSEPTESNRTTGGSDA